MPPTLGEVVLRPHQAEAVRSIRAAFREFGGALLADDPGLGKTFVALAIAAEYPHTLVAAPSALRSMWVAAAARCGVVIEFVSLEALSRGRGAPPAPLLIVDEAHHAANPAARRYPALSLLAQRAKVLLLSATPVRNSSTELDALLGLFLSSRALDDAARARCTIRRATTAESGIPARDTRPAIVVPMRAPVAVHLRGLPPPLPVADGSAATGIVRAGLARCWASSLAALDRALRRRLQRGAALRASLEAGRLPTRLELRAWVVGDDSMQLAFPLLGGALRADVAACVRALERHIAAVQALRDITHPAVQRDAACRAGHLLAICERHAGASVIAFTSFEATATALFSHLRQRPGTVLLTSTGARSAAGALDRSWVIEALGARPHDAAPRTDSSARRNCVRLVIATDLLAEGVNLQGASVVVHLDLPWTPAALDQRVGRAARIGSSHQTVFDYRFAAPKGADRILRFARLQRRKSDHASRALAPGTAQERIRVAVRSWRADSPDRSPAVAAATGAHVDGFLACVESASRAWLLGGIAKGSAPLRVSDDPGTIALLAEAVRRDDPLSVDRREVDRVARAVVRWLSRRDGAVTAGVSGVGGGSSVARRRVLARLDHLLHTASPSHLPTLAARVGRVRGTLHQSASAAVELHLQALLGGPSDSREWLDDLEQRLAGVARRWTDARGSSQLKSILLLRRRPAAKSS